MEVKVSKWAYPKPHATGSRYNKTKNQLMRSITFQMVHFYSFPHENRISLFLSLIRLVSKLGGSKEIGEGGKDNTMLTNFGTL